MPVKWGGSSLTAVMAGRYHPSTNLLLNFGERAGFGSKPSAGVIDRAGVVETLPVPAANAANSEASFRASTGLGGLLRRK